jgi:hypothetical protein
MNKKEKRKINEIISCFDYLVFFPIYFRRFYTSIADDTKANYERMFRYNAV